MNSSTATQIQALEAAGDYSGAAVMYLSLQGSDAEQREWRLRAAEAYRRDGKLDLAVATLEPLAAAPLDADQSARAGIIRADAALAAGQPEQALRHLPALTPEVQGDRRIDILTIRIAAYRAAGSNADAMLDALQLQRIVTNSDARLAVENEIWSLLDALDPEELQSLASLDPSLPGWIILHDVAAISLDQPAEFESRMSAWQRDYPAHPGNERAVQLSLARSNPRPPTDVALLLPLSDRYAGAGEAVRDGFLMGEFLATGSRPVIRVYDTGGQDAVQAYQQAVREGASLVVGPLLKDDVEALTQLPGRTVPLLALNRVGQSRPEPDPEAISADQIPVEEPTAGEAPTEQPAVTDAQRAAEDGLAPVSGPMGTVSTTQEPPATPAVVEGAAVYQFGLAPEDDARAAAQRANAEDLARALVLYPDNDWGWRIEQAFSRSFEEGGGFVADTASYDPSGADFSAPIKALLQLDASEERRRAVERRLGTKVEFEPRRRQDADVLIIAATPVQGRQVYPQLRFNYLGTLPTWATASVYAGSEDTIQNQDLNGLQFTDIPWLLDRGRLPAELQDDDVLLDPAMRNSRLFALGLDAYRLMPWLPALASSPVLAVNGATGRLSVDSEDFVRRQDLVWAEFREGIALPLDGDASAMLVDEGQGNEDAALQ